MITKQDSFRNTCPQTNTWTALKKLLHHSLANQEIGNSNPCRGRKMFLRHLSRLCPWKKLSHRMSTLTIHCRWEDQVARERTRHTPAAAYAKIKNWSHSLTLRTHGWPSEILYETALLPYINKTASNIHKRRQTEKRPVIALFICTFNIHHPKAVSISRLSISRPRRPTEPQLLITISSQGLLYSPAPWEPILNKEALLNIHSWKYTLQGNVCYRQALRCC